MDVVVKSVISLRLIGGEVGNNTLVVVNIDVHTEQKFSLITANQLNY